MYRRCGWEDELPGLREAGNISVGISVGVLGAKAPLSPSTSEICPSDGVEGKLGAVGP